MTTIVSNSPDGIILVSPAYSSPVTINGGVVIGGNPDSGNGIAAYSGTWTITNAGTVTETGKGGSGVYLADGGAVINQTGGVIGASTSAGGAIYILGSTGTVINAGSIRAGVWLQSGGAVTNQTGGKIVSVSTSGGYGVGFELNGTLVNAGLISGLLVGVDESTTGGTVTNQFGGTIEGPYAGIIFGLPNEGTAGGRYLYNQAGGLVTGDSGVFALDASASVVNAGTITGTFAGTVSQDGITLTVGAGVYLGAGGTVTNQFGGGITGISYGIAVNDGAGTVFNEGQITAAGSGTLFARAVALLTGGYVSNGSTGSIVNAGDGNAIRVQIAAGTIVNAGSLINDEAGHSAVALQAGGRITNVAGGLIQGKAWTGIYGTGAAVAIVNAGTVLGDAGGSTASGVSLLAGGTVTNQLGGNITGAIYGIIINNAGGTVFNSGQITALGSGTTLSRAVALFGGGYLSNAATGRIDSDGNGGAIRIQAAAGTIYNAGTLTNSFAGRSAVALQAGGSVTNVAGGLVQAGASTGIYGTGGAMTVVNGGIITGATFGVTLAGGGTVTNAGTITGNNGTAVAFGGSLANRLVLDPGYALNGAADGSPAASNTLELASAASAGLVSDLGTHLTDFNAIQFDPGSNWFISGDATGLDGTISGFFGGDTIEVTGITVTGSLYAGGTLTLTEASGSATLDLPGDFSTSQFTVTNVAGGAEVTVATPRTLSWTGGGGSAAFGAQANWDDLTDSLSPALTAPGMTDTAVFDTSDGGITGTGTVAAVDVGSDGDGVLELSGGGSLTAGLLDAGVLTTDAGQIGLTGAGTGLSITGAATVADAGAGVLSVLNGATFSAASLTVGANKGSSGAVIVSGAGSDLVVSGALNIGTALGTGDLTIGPSAAVHAAVVNLDGQVVQEGGLLDPSVTVINPNKSLGGSGTVASGDIIDEGILQAGDGTPGQLELVQGTIVGGGTLTENGSKVANKANAVGVLQINTFGTMEVDGAVLNAATTTFANDVTPATTYTVTHSVIDVNFEDSTGVLQLDDIGGFGGTIATFQAGDQFIITSGTLSGLGVNNGTTLTMADSGNGGTDQIIFGSPVSASYFNIVAGNTIEVVACFAAGTLIETSAGPVAVEALAVGERVLTVNGRADGESATDNTATEWDGAYEPIVWIGQRTVDCERHREPETVWPVRVRAWAFGENVPVRDLYLSPDHAVFVNGVLVPVRLLINGTSIARVKRERVTYYHVELPKHALILAEGLTVESYLDLGDRANFDHGPAIRLFPDFAARPAGATARLWEARGAAPLVLAGEELSAARRKTQINAQPVCARKVGTVSRSA